MSTVDAKQLRQQLRQINMDIQYEKRQLNEFQQQKERIEQFWATMKNSRDELKLQLRQKLREKQDLEEKHAFELKVYKQKVKHLLHENQHTAGLVRVENAEAVKSMEVTDRGDQSEQKDELRELRKLQRERANAHWEVVKELRIAQDKRITALREEYTRRAMEAKEYYDQKTNDAIAELDQERRASVGRLENKLHAFTQRLLAEHQAQLRDMQAYYRDIKYANLALIKTLKEDVARLQTRDEKLTKEVAGVTRLHNKLKQPLRENLEKLAKLKARLAEYHKDQAELGEVGAAVRSMETRVRNLEWEHEVMVQRVERVKLEKEQVRKKLDKAIQNVRANAKFREVLVEKKVRAASIDVEKTATAVHEIAVASGIAEIDSDVKDSLEAVLVAKNMVIQHLEKTLVEIRQSHKAAIESFEAKLRANNIPLEALAFEPVRDL